MRTREGGPGRNEGNGDFGAVRVGNSNSMAGSYGRFACCGIGLHVFLRLRQDGGWDTLDAIVRLEICLYRVSRPLTYDDQGLT